MQDGKMNSTLFYLNGGLKQEKGILESSMCTLFESKWLQSRTRIPLFSGTSAVASVEMDPVVNPPEAEARR